MGQKKLTGEDAIFTNCPLCAHAAIQNDLDEGMTWEDERHIFSVSDLVFVISHGLKNASHFRRRLQEEIKDILSRQSLNVHAGVPSAKWDESEEQGR
ncbi:MAG: hypothetical protein AB1552_13930 [Nitrospirota bacterium]